MKKTINYLLCIIGAAALICATTPKNYIAQILPVNTLAVEKGSSIPLPYDEHSINLAHDGQTDTDLAAIKAKSD